MNESDPSLIRHFERKSAEQSGATVVFPLAVLATIGVGVFINTAIKLHQIAVAYGISDYQAWQRTGALDSLLAVGGGAGVIAFIIYGVGGRHGRG